MKIRMRKPFKEHEQGFTLIELLVVIIIIGILAAIAIPVFLNQRQKGVDASLKADLKNAATAAETYGTDSPTAANFGASAAAIKANLAAAGFKATPGNEVEIKGSPATGYCIESRSPNSSDPPSWIMYDSRKGGLSIDWADPTPGACSNVVNPGPWATIS